MKKTNEKNLVTAVTINNIPLDLHEKMNQVKNSKRKQGYKINYPDLYLEYAMKGLKSEGLI